MNKAVFFDRDGVLNKEIGDYICKIEDFQLLPDAVECIAMAKDNGFKVFIITNQGGIDKKRYTHADLATFHQVIIDACAQRGVIIDEIFYCPHHPIVGNCLCRKPGSLMIEKAIAKYQIDPAKSIMFGDTDRDMEAAACCNVLGILVQPNSDKISLLKKEIQRINNI